MTQAPLAPPTFPECPSWCDYTHHDGDEVHDIGDSRLVVAARIHEHEIYTAMLPDGDMVADAAADTRHEVKIYLERADYDDDAAPGAERLILEIVGDTYLRTGLSNAALSSLGNGVATAQAVVRSSAVALADRDEDRLVDPVAA